MEGSFPVFQGSVVDLVSNLVEVGERGVSKAVLVLVLPVEAELEEAPPLSNLFLDSQEAMQSRVSWRRVWCLRTCQQGTKMVKISMTKMESAILGQGC